MTAPGRPGRSFGARTAGGRGRRNDAGEAEAKLRRATAGAKARCDGAGEAGGA